MIRVLLADDQAVVRAGVRMILEAHDDIEVAGEAVNGLEAVELSQSLDPDVVLTDIRMPVLDGIEATHRLVDGGHPRARAGAHDLRPRRVRVRGAESRGGRLLREDRLTRTTRRRSSPRCRRGSAAGTRNHAAPDRTLPRRRPTERPTAAGTRRTTPRELEVLNHIASGSSNAEIATALYVSEGTVKTHVARILAKLNLRDRVQAVVFAYECGLARPGARAPTHIDPRPP